MKSEKLQFEGSDGDLLTGQFDQPEGDRKACALFAHCFTCTRNLKAVGNIAKALTSRGIAVFRFDFTGLGESEGDFADTNFSSNVMDLIAAARYMSDRWSSPSILAGHSFGGSAVLRAAHSIADVRAVVTIAAPHDPRHVERLLVSGRDEIEREGVARVSIGGREFTMRKQFLEDLESSSSDSKISALDKALLVMHSPVDNIVGIDNAAGIFKAAKHPKSFISLDDADHLLMNERDSRYAGSMVAAWAERYL
ncbi:MAG: alpha/beta fold hydrolase [Thermoanaerobaculia bacterium]|nr:alpha/beta fold hydrolase [Thermoanaerobaculia bacterium]